jgi:hypothetical protein
MSDFTRAEMKIRHRGAETQRGKERGKGNVYDSVISLYLPLFLCVSVPLWLITAWEE